MRGEEVDLVWSTSPCSKQPIHIDKVGRTLINHSSIVQNGLRLQSFPLLCFFNFLSEFPGFLQGPTEALRSPQQDSTRFADSESWRQASYSDLQGCVPLVFGLDQALFRTAQAKTPHCTPALHSCTALLHCTPALHPCTAPLHCTPALHPCTALLHCTPALHPCTAPLHSTCTALLRCIRVQHWPIFTQISLINHTNWQT